MTEPPATTSDHGADRLVAWIDGSCPLCLASSSWIRHRDRCGVVDFRDFNAGNQGSLPRELPEHQRQLWVRSPDGSLDGGYAAVLRLLAELPGWRWLAIVGSWPPLGWFGDRLYAWVARHRPRRGAPP